MKNPGTLDQVDLQPKTRFTSKAGFYEARPDYPGKVVTILQDELNLKPVHIIADIGAGTGKLTRLFLENGNTVYAVEPNLVMLSIARKLLNKYPDFHPFEACAETTGLKTGSVDYIVVGQAHHWFEKQEALSEFHRILKNPGFLAIIGKKTTYLENELEEKINRLEDEFCFRGQRKPDHVFYDVSTYFEPTGSVRKTFSVRMQLTPEQALERLLSSSFAPSAGKEEYKIYRQRLIESLNHYQKNNMIDIELSVIMNYARIK